MLGLNAYGVEFADYINISENGRSLLTSEGPNYADNKSIIEIDTPDENKKKELLTSNVPSIRSVMQNLLNSEKVRFGAYTENEDTGEKTYIYISKDSADAIAISPIEYLSRIKDIQKDLLVLIKKGNSIDTLVASSPSASVLQARFADLKNFMDYSVSLNTQLKKMKRDSGNDPYSLYMPNPVNIQAEYNKFDAAIGEYQQNGDDVTQNLNSNSTYINNKSQEIEKYQQEFEVNQNMIADVTSQKNINDAKIKEMEDKYYYINNAIASTSAKIAVLREASKDTEELNIIYSNLNFELQDINGKIQKLKSNNFTEQIYTLTARNNLLSSNINRDQADINSKLSLSKEYIDKISTVYFQKIYQAAIELNKKIYAGNVDAPKNQSELGLYWDNNKQNLLYGNILNKTGFKSTLIDLRNKKVKPGEIITISLEYSPDGSANFNSTDLVKIKADQYHDKLISLNSTSFMLLNGQGALGTSILVSKKARPGEENIFSNDAYNFLYGVNIAFAPGDLSRGNGMLGLALVSGLNFSSLNTENPIFLFGGGYGFSSSAPPNPYIAVGIDLDSLINAVVHISNGKND